jgi:AcrR family transcriptional regulator
MVEQLRRRTGIDADKILDAALTLFAKQGYQVTSMDEIGSSLGIKGPSLYNHVRSKQDVLVAIMTNTMGALIRAQDAALEAGGDFRTQLRRVVEAHVRYHASHPREAFVGNREIGSLETKYRVELLELRDAYEHKLRSLIEDGSVAGEFSVPSAKLVSYAILEMGIGVATWFNPQGELGVDEVAYVYAEMSLRMVTMRTHTEETSLL